MIFYYYFINIKFIKFNNSKKRFIAKLRYKFVFLLKSQYLNYNNEIFYIFFVVYFINYYRLIIISL